MKGWRWTTSHLTIQTSYAHGKENQSINNRSACVRTFNARQLKGFVQISLQVSGDIFVVDGCQKQAKSETTEDSGGMNRDRDFITWKQRRRRERGMEKES